MKSMMPHGINGLDRVKHGNEMALLFETENYNFYV
jgi:hypothetical protein